LLGRIIYFGNPRFALLDFRTTDVSELRENFWYILLDSDFKSAIVRRQGHEDIVVKFLGGQ